MNIKRLESEKRKKNYRYDSKLGLWIAYQADVTANGKRHRPKFPTKNEAEKYIDELRIRSAYTKAGLKTPRSALRIVRISELFERRLRLIRNDRERNNAATAFERFRNVVGFDAPVTDIAKAHFQLYANSRMHSVIPDTIRREMTRIATAFSTAEEMFPVELEGYEPPKVVRPKAKRRDGINRRVITSEEKDLICAGLRERPYVGRKQISDLAAKMMSGMFEIGWLLGLRYSEILGLKKIDFNAGRKQLRVRRFKTDTGSTLEFLPDRAIEILTEISALSDGETIFTRSISTKGFEKALKQVCEANKIPYGRKNPDGITFHSTRHSFTTRLIQVTDIATATAFTGHSDKEMVAYYAHASESSKAKAMAALYGGGEMDDDLKVIFEKVSDGKMTFTAFRAAILELQNKTYLPKSRHAFA